MPKKRGLVTNMGMDFHALMREIRSILETEKCVGKRKLSLALRIQVAQVAKTLKPRANPLSDFQWRVYKSFSSHFRLDPVKPGYDLPVLPPRPYLNISQLELVDFDLMSFDDLVDFIQFNGSPYSRWPKKPKKKTRGKKPIVHMRQLCDGTIVPAPLPLPSSVCLVHTGLTQSRTVYPAPLPLKAMPAPTSFTPVPQPIWDNDIEMRSPSRVVEKPRAILSFACRPGWDLNKKATWVPAIGITPEPSGFLADTPESYHSLDQPSIGSIMFTRASEKDVEVFLKSFLGQEEGPNGALNETS